MDSTQRNLDWLSDDPQRPAAPGLRSSLVYFSSVSENTHRFVQKLGVPATRIRCTAASRSTNRTY